LSDELDIVGADLEVLGVGSGKINNTGSGESRGLQDGSGVKDDGVESFRRCCALMIGL
jgi:hypothetical protein